MIFKMDVVHVIVFSCLCVLLCNAAIVITTGPDLQGHAEVQNMMRNSEQRLWCQPGNIKQVITHSNCVSKTVANQVCAGSCYSYTLPQTDPETAGDENLDFCESCQPSDSHWINVTLECTAEDESTYEITKNVQQIANCSCASCPGTRKFAPDTDDQSSNDGQRIPFLLSAALPLNEENLKANGPGQVPFLLSSPNLLTSTTADPVSSSTTSPPISESSSTSDSSTITTTTTTTTPASVIITEENDVEEDSFMVENDKVNYSPISFNKPDIGPQFGFGGPSMLHGQQGHPSEQENHINLLEIVDGSSNEEGNEEPIHNQKGLVEVLAYVNNVREGEGSVEYTQMSLYELKRAMNLQPHQADRLAGKAVYSVAPLGTEEDN